MRKLGLSALIVAHMIIVLPGVSQTVLWSEDFGSCNSGCAATGYSGANGAWSVSITGANGSDANMWYVSAAECGNSSGACGTACSSDASLHISTSSTVLGDLGAAYLAGGSGFWFVEASARAESPTIDLTGQSNVTLSFNYIEDYVGQAGYDPDDHATLWYFDGSTWAQIDPLAVTPAGCQPQGTWATYSALLPASANNNPNVRIGFEWVNDDDNVGSDPSFAVDDIELTIPSTAPPTASFTPSQTSLCEGDCISFTDNSTTGNTITSWDWTFQGGSPASASGQTPGQVCWSTAGTYDVTLSVTDGNGTDDTTIQVTVTTCVTPVADFSMDTTICEGDCIALTDQSTGPPSSWTWTINGGTPSTSTQQSPTVCFNTAGTYDVQLVVCTSTACDSLTQSITVGSTPTVSAGPDVTIGAGQSANLDATGSAGDYIWSPSTDLSCTNCQSTVATPSTTTTYTITVTDPTSGCFATDDVTVIVDIDSAIGIPSAFSPNGDGVNDELHVLGQGIETMTLKVFNRYGQKVFETTDQAQGWDGTYNGKACNPGVFAYVLEYQFTGGQLEVKKGNVTLVK